MTAIFAYASGDEAFVAGDTLRNIPMFGVVQATKVHQWSDTVLLAQAGDGKFQSELLGALKLARPMLGYEYPTEAEDERFLAGFTRMWPSHHERALESVANLKSGAAHISGTVLVAAAGDQFGAARIHKLDFATGTHATLATDMIADGTDPDQFTEQGRSLLDTMHSPLRRFPFDDWGTRCIDLCVKAYPGQVGWPADMILSRPSGDERVSIHRRVLGSESFISLSEFLA